MKTRIYLFTAGLIVSTLVACTPSIIPDTVTPDSEGQQENVTPDIEDNSDIVDTPDSSNVVPPPTPPDPEPEPDPGESNPGDNEPENVVFKFVYMASERDVCYNGCHIVSCVRTNVGVNVEIPQDCDWVHFYKTVEYKGDMELWFTVDGLPQTTSQCDKLLFDYCCSHEDRTCVVNIWDDSGKRCLKYTIHQLCYGCSCGLEQGDDAIFRF